MTGNVKPEAVEAAQAPWMKRLCPCGNAHEAKGLCKTCYRRHLRRQKGMKEKRPLMSKPHSVAVVLEQPVLDVIKGSAKQAGLPVSVFLREVLSELFRVQMPKDT